MLEPGSCNGRATPWTGWTMGRTKASSGLSAEEYGRILSFFDECGPEHGPQRVQEEMGIPHKEDKLPQTPVLGMNETPHCTSSPCCDPVPYALPY